MLAGLRQSLEHLDSAPVSPVLAFLLVDEGGHFGIGTARRARDMSVRPVPRGRQRRPRLLPMA
ncbi:hypothetical protein GCM10023220_42560 [Streptomyces ziwulingensis]|uniref:Uncharacterized protein n=1 Tax=Streptomyces ziwulingensis TaxID=1045501 RepID=A0ABP9CBL8_9ACTN